VLKKVLPWAALIVVLVYIVRNPTGTGHLAHHLMSNLASAGHALGQFFTTLVRGK
jgi:sorbitol-specific phosphotransferase system component IIBC